MTIKLEKKTLKVNGLKCKEINTSTIPRNHMTFKMDSLSLIQVLKQELHIDVQIAYSLVLLKLLSHVKQKEHYYKIIKTFWEQFIAHYCKERKPQFPFTTTPKIMQSQCCKIVRS